MKNSLLKMQAKERCLQGVIHHRSLAGLLTSCAGLAAGQKCSDTAKTNTEKL